MENKNSAEEIENQKDGSMEQSKEAQDMYEGTTKQTDMSDSDTQTEYIDSPQVEEEKNTEETSDKTEAATENESTNDEDVQTELLSDTEDKEEIDIDETTSVEIPEQEEEQIPVSNENSSDQSEDPESPINDEPVMVEKPEQDTEPTDQQETEVLNDASDEKSTEESEAVSVEEHATEDIEEKTGEQDTGNETPVPDENVQIEEEQPLDVPFIDETDMTIETPTEDIAQPDSEESSEEKKPKKKKKQKKEKANLSRGRKIFNGFVIFFLICALVGSVSGFAILANIVGKVSADGLAEKMVSKDSSIFLAKDGKTVIGELGGESRENITYEQVPQSTIDAFLAIEDSRFYKHNGFDLPRFISSALNNLRSGNLSQGGSTLTMQTVDNFVMKPQEDKLWEEKQQVFSKKEKIERKIQEIYLSMEVEKDLTKEEIMTKYLNQINFGQHTRGIQKGAQYYFGKNVEELNLSESAFLAGVINAPNDNNPYSGYDAEKNQNFYEAATKRRNDTLYQMLNHGYITETEYKLTKATKLAFLLNGEPTTEATDPYKDYVRAAADEIIEKYGVDPATTPMIVYTALDMNAQKAANKVSSGDVVGFSNNKYYQIGFSVLDNKTGEIRAICPGRSDIKSADGITHYRFREPHQPGSSIKPIMDYAPSFDMIGYCTGRVYKDKEMYVGGWRVVNASQSYYGKVSMERAIAQSLNTPAVQTFSSLLDGAGYDGMIEYGKKMGFDADVMKELDIQYSIGASKMLASPTEMAAAYATLANGGTYIEPHMVRKFVYKDDDKTVKAKIKKAQPLSPQAAYMTSELLYSAIFGKDNGWNLMSRLGFGAYPVYGKTGTSDWADEAWKYGGAMKDEWMINYTSEYTIATWSGFDRGVEGGGTYISEELLYANIPGWINKYMLDSITTDNVHRIPNPGGISSYGGGMIKDEWLASAAKNNPMTIANSKTDNKGLKSALESAKGMKESDYTSATYAKLKQAIAAAEKLIKDDMSPQEDIDKAKAAIEAAIKGLESSANKSGLSSALSSASGIDTSQYTPESANALTSAINSARGVLDNKKSTQAEIDAQTNAIKQAISGLQAKPAPVDRNSLYAAITSANDLENNKAAYTPESYAEFRKVVENATAIYNNQETTQAQVDEQVSLINKAQVEILKPVQP